MYYEVEGTNLRVLGSMHSLPEGSKLPGWVSDAFDWCEVWFREGDYPTEFQKQRILRFQDGSTLKQRMPQSLWDKLALKETANLKPWALLATAPEAREWPLIGGVEVGFEFGPKGRKPAGFLETFEDTAKIFESVPEEVYFQALDFFIEHEDALWRELVNCFNAWSRGSLFDVVRCSALEPTWSFPRLREAWFYERNRRWMDRIKMEFGSPNKTLIAVGANHLGGHDGLIQLFAKEGNHKLIPIPLQ